MGPLTLVSNPGSASRKYALFSGSECLASLHFEYSGDAIVYSVERGGQTTKPAPAGLSHLTFAGGKLFPILNGLGLLESEDQIDKIALRIVAPSSFFQVDRLIDKGAMEKLAGLEARASLHINAGLQEIHVLKQLFPGAKIIGISDSAFHRTMPDFAHLYGLPLEDSLMLEVRRFGYHGLSVESVTKKLQQANKLPHRAVVCHLGSGVSITALRGGKSMDTTMGYSPLEGPIMATRSGSLDVTAAQVLHDELQMSGQQLQHYLNNQSGLLGISGKSSDIRELLKAEADGGDRAKLALRMYVYRVQQAIGQMAAALGGVDGLVFCGTVGERSAEIRRRVTGHLLYLGLALDAKVNHHVVQPAKIARISPAAHPAKIYVVPSDENSIMAARAAKIL